MPPKRKEERDWSGFLRALESAMDQRGYSLYRLAENSGVAYGTMTAWFDTDPDKRHGPSETNVRKLAHHFQLKDATHWLRLADLEVLKEPLSQTKGMEPIGIGNPALDLALAEASKVLTPDKLEELARFVVFLTKEELRRRSRMSKPK